MAEPKRGKIPELYFGQAGERGIDWRTLPTDDVDGDPDKPTSPEVVQMLGFDPDE